MPFRDYKTPLLDKIIALFADHPSHSLDHTYIFACQHILEPKEKMFSALVEVGIPKENIFIIGKAYSTNSKLLEELQKENFQAEQPLFQNAASFDTQHSENCEGLFERFKDRVKSPARVIILDDGGFLLSVFNTHFSEIKSNIKILGVEQTSSGFRLLEKDEIKFPIINVARSAIKLNKESTYIAEDCYQKINLKLNDYKVVKKGFLIIGLGPIGSALLQLLKEAGQKAVGYDTALGHTNLLAFIKKSKPNVIIGATGTQVLSREDIEILNELRYPIYLASVSSSDREFPISSFRKLTEHNIHQDVVYENTIFFNNGFPINFQGNRQEGSIEGIERTICLLLGSVLYLAKNEMGGNMLEGFCAVPKIITDIL